MSQSLVTVSYLAAVILFILSLGGLSNPESSRRGNLYGMIGMAIAVLATVLGPRVTSGGIAWIVGALVIGAAVGLYLARTVLDDADARAGGVHAQPRGPGRGARRLRELHRPERLGRHVARGARHPRRRDLRRRPDRRRDPLGLGDRVRQAVRAHHRQARAAARAPLAQPRGAARGDRVRLRLPARRLDPRRHDAARRDDRGGAPLRRAHGDGDRRRRHARRRLDAQQLLGLGRGRDRLHARQRPADRDGRPGRLERRDPLVHHVPRDEPQVPGGDRGRVRRRHAGEGGRGRRRARRGGDAR